MRKLVLSVEQMKELEMLGIDTSDASLYYYPYQNTYILGIRFEDKFDSLKVPAYTLEDIIEKLPSNIPEESYDGYCSGSSSLVITKKYTGYQSWHLDDHFVIKFEESMLIDSAFKMLKWCKERNHI